LVPFLQVIATETSVWFVKEFDTIAGVTGFFANLCHSFESGSGPFLVPGGVPISMP
jgi:hypothetical protein